jgi:uncharacterized protein
MANTIVWFDIPVKNIQRATEFYSKLLDKSLSINEEHGFKMTVFPHADNSSDVSGCLVECNESKANDSGLLIYFDANRRIHEAVAAAKINGGKLIDDVKPIGPWGFRAVIEDCEGNKVALHAMQEK